MRIAQALDLRGQSDSYERQEAIWLLEHILQCSALELKYRAMQNLSPEQEKQYLDGLMRLAKGEPLAYVLGTQPFWTLDLKVTSDTLVPRPDTEILIETVLSLDLPYQANVVDLGTGTGAIALSLASERPHWRIVATDVYSATLQIAKENARKHQLEDQVEFCLGIWYQALSTQHFDLIVSNPPYIDPEDPHVAALRYEPQRALVAQEQGLSDLIHIIQYASQWLNPNGWIVLEHGYDQAQAVQQLFAKYGFQNIRSVQDYGGNDRVTLAQYN
ncbi:peptide chain release factor N(5)-glutamine methyltransferase [Acinetobacter qingfengensis]|uniref:Release factor glutamine methyltransferase n=1 Tax=Acinetobacter qingfengensis TaxID=1262585 RepID=A0A1E7RDM0_9GAMM|nr:peptide chain release factor N(5)-glutamine methyltransferase [Acinetobacter qingfengensis]KAA8735323.1 peptide chain release factor N(5)-glutamine methyltransferase [Acinetobacter qingfengensis]OEY97441.1 protein-(glutamine-N5) methyltransferase, release factor-specific [Acinetobacter qingfengensis]